MVRMRGLESDAALSGRLRRSLGRHLGVQRKRERFRISGGGHNEADHFWEQNAKIVTPSNLFPSGLTPPPPLSSLSLSQPHSSSSQVDASALATQTAEKAEVAQQEAEFDRCVWRSLPACAPFPRTEL